MKYCISFILTMFACLSFGADFSIRLDEKPMSLHTHNGDTVTLGGAKLFYKDKDGDTTPAEEGYFVEVINNSYPIIVDTLKGHVVSLRVADVDENKGDEVLVFYMAGAHQYGVNIYTIESVLGTQITPLKTQPVSSNMHSVEVKGKDIVVKNEEIGADGKRFVSTDTYNVIKGDCKLVHEEMSAVGQ